MHSEWVVFSPFIWLAGKFAFYFYMDFNASSFLTGAKQTNNQLDLKYHLKNFIHSKYM